MMPWYLYRPEYISIHALVKRATVVNIHTATERVISIHALVKRATRQLVQGCPYRYNFNPRPREEGDRPTVILSATGVNFNPRPREEGDEFFTAGRDTLQDFNPRPREEGDIAALEAEIKEIISIHALVKRATYIEYRQGK